MTTLSTNSSIFLPRGIICDILSYLPVKSLLRFKCVCKHWTVIAEDFPFICLHYKHAPLIIEEKPPQTHSNATAGREDEFKPLYSKGLLLECATRPSDFPSSHNLRYRIRNPGMQHQILEIPDSQSIILDMFIVFDPDCQVLKLVSVVYEFIGDQVLGYEVLDLRNEESSYSWRPLILPKQSRGETRMCTPVKKHSKQIKVLIATGGTAYCIWDNLANSHIGIDILDMVNDSYIGHTTLPKGFYSKEDCIFWKEKLISFSKIVKEELHVMVLDYDHKKHFKWADGKFIIKLPFLKDLSVVPQIKVLRASSSKLYFRWQDRESRCCYDINTGKVTTLMSTYKESQVLYFIRPCLFTFKGMQS